MNFILQFSKPCRVKSFGRFFHFICFFRSIELSAQIRHIAWGPIIYLHAGKVHIKQACGIMLYIELMKHVLF